MIWVMNFKDLTSLAYDDKSVVFFLFFIFVVNSFSSDPRSLSKNNNQDYLDV